MSFDPGDFVDGLAEFRPDVRRLGTALAAIADERGVLVLSQHRMRASFARQAGLTSRRASDAWRTLVSASRVALEREANRELGMARAWRLVSLSGPATAKPEPTGWLDLDELREKLTSGAETSHAD